MALWEFLNENYQFIKALHFAAFVSWMAALFYMPRLFVYHTENKQNADFVCVVKVQERRLYRGIQIPAMVGSLVTGFAMIYAKFVIFPSTINSGFEIALPSYMHLKLTAVVLLLVYHFAVAHYIKALRDDKCTRSGVFFRAFNEIPTLLFLVIVFSFAFAGVL